MYGLYENKNDFCVAEMMLVWLIERVFPVACEHVHMGPGSLLNVLAY